jgi:hypothetical protein
MLGSVGVKIGVKDRGQIGGFRHTGMSPAIATDRRAPIRAASFTQRPRKRQFSELLAIPSGGHHDEPPARKEHPTASQLLGEFRRVKKQVATTRDKNRSPLKTRERRDKLWRIQIYNSLPRLCPL